MQFIYLNFLPLTTIPSLKKWFGGILEEGVLCLFWGSASKRHSTQSAYLESATRAYLHIFMHWDASFAHPNALNL